MVSTPTSLMPSQAVFHLFAAYSAPERHYHNLEHIQSMFRELEAYLQTPNGEKEDPELVHLTSLAIIFHDVVYVPGRTNNEDRSAVYAADVLQDMRYTATAIDSVMQMIKDTALHYCSTGNQESALLLDLDLFGLGLPMHVYDTAAEKVRAEFSDISDEAWRDGRLKFLQSMLGRERLFNLPYFFEKYESQARSNMFTEKCRMEGKNVKTNRIPTHQRP